MPGRRCRRRVQVAVKPREEAVCCFCKKVDSSVVCDKLLSGKITVHFYCLLFSSGLQQRGDVKGPLMGFLEADVKVELQRGAKLRCVYCKKQGATVGCCIKMCKEAFHVGCGNANECLLQFHGDYRAYCPDHRPRQRIRPKESGSTSCLICTCDMVSEPSPQVLVTPCCQHSFHRACLQAQASSAGSYFFKCCICNNIDAFQKEMLDHGICIPQQDASWEREQGAYQDLLYRYQRCDAERCRCPNGRETSLEESGDWEVITCSTCGSQGIHKACRNLSKEPLQRTNSWVCVQCRKTLSLTEKLDTADWVFTPLVRKGEPKTGASNIAGETSNGTTEKSTSSADQSAKAAAEPPDRETARLLRKRKADRLRGVRAAKRSAGPFASSASVRESQHEGHEGSASETSMQETGETRRPRPPAKSKKRQVSSSSRASESAEDGARSQSVSVEMEVTKAVDDHSSASPSTGRPSTSTSVRTMPSAGERGQTMISCRNGKLCAAIKPRVATDTFVGGAIEKTTTSGKYLGHGCPREAVLPVPPRMMQLLPPSDAATVRKPKPKPKPIPKKSSGVQLSLLSYLRQFKQHKSETEKHDTADWIFNPLVRKRETKTGASIVANEASNGTTEKSTSSADRSAEAAVEPPDSDAARLPRKRKADQPPGPRAPEQSAGQSASSVSDRESQHEGHEGDASKTSMRETGETRRPRPPAKSKKRKVISSSGASQSAEDRARSQAVSVETEVTEAVDDPSSALPSTGRPSTSTSVGTVPLAGAGGQATISCRNGKLCVAIKPRFATNTFARGARKKMKTVATASGGCLREAVLPIPPRMMRLLPPSGTATIRKRKLKPIPKKSSGIQLSLLSYLRQFMQHKSEGEN